MELRKPLQYITMGKILGGMGSLVLITSLLASSLDQVSSVITLLFLFAGATYGYGWLHRHRLVTIEEKISQLERTKKEQESLRTKKKRKLNEYLKSVDES